MKQKGCPKCGRTRDSWRCEKCGLCTVCCTHNETTEHFDNPWDGEGT